MNKKQQAEEKTGEKKPRFLRELAVSNFGVFPFQKKESDFFRITFNEPDMKTPGSGLTVILGSNNCGKSTLLRVIQSSNFSEDDLNVHSKNQDFTVKKDAVVVRHNFRETGSIGLKPEQETPCRFIHNFQSRQSLLDGMGYAVSEMHVADQELNQFLNSFNKNIFDSILVATPFLGKCFDVKVQPGISGLHKWNYIEKVGNKEIDMRRIGDGTLQAGFVLGNMMSSHYDEIQIFLSDEPDTHIDALRLSDIAHELIQISKTKQIIITTHSSILVREIVNHLYHDNRPEKEINEDFIRKRFRILIKKTKKTISLKKEIEDLCLVPEISADEINYVAFKIPTPNYYVQLYEEFKRRISPLVKEEQKNQKATNPKPPSEDCIRENLIVKTAEKLGVVVKRETTVNNKQKRGITPLTYLRHAICHPSPDNPYTEEQVKEEISAMREIFINNKKQKILPEKSE